MMNVSRLQDVPLGQIRLDQVRLGSVGLGYVGFRTVQEVSPDRRQSASASASASRGRYSTQVSIYLQLYVAIDQIQVGKVRYSTVQYIGTGGFLGGRLLNLRYMCLYTCRVAIRVIKTGMGGVGVNMYIHMKRAELLEPHRRIWWRCLVLPGRAWVLLNQGVGTIYR